MCSFLPSGKVCRYKTWPLLRQSLSAIPAAPRTDAAARSAHIRAPLPSRPPNTALPSPSHAAGCRTADTSAAHRNCAVGEEHRKTVKPQNDLLCPPKPPGARMPSHSIHTRTPCLFCKNLPRARQCGIPCRKALRPHAESRDRVAQKAQ